MGARLQAIHPGLANLHALPRREGRGIQPRLQPQPVEQGAEADGRQFRVEVRPAALLRQLPQHADQQRPVLAIGMTTSLAALIAAVGLAIGMAWSGLLANLAAGGFIIVLRPFKVGDFICAGGVTGTVKEIGLFTTAINTPDNVLTMVGNNKIFGDNIQNFTHNPFRRVELKAQLSGAADYQAAIALLRQRVAAIPNVLGEPPVDVEILEFNLVGPVLAVRPYCHNDHYWQVYFDTNKVIKDALGADFPAPMPAQTVIVQQSAGA
ncbi:mechanosensitive ion channel protein MscS [Pseudomonas aeruginosa]|nr:mechanosensitive ion channel protein MscS [Pseudomonas aeruginosa]